MTAIIHFYISDFNKVIKMQKKSERITVITIMIMMLILSVSVIVMPKKDFSENENRYLASFPEFSTKTFFSGEYMEKVEGYLTDHFAFRDIWVFIDCEKNILMGKCEINGILIGKDGQLYGSYEEPANTDTICKILKTFIGQTKENYPDVNVELMLVPTALTIYSENLPADVNVTNQLNTIEYIYQYCEIDGIDVSQKLFQAKDEKRLYYMTDHHWTTYGAYQGYLAYCESEGLNPVDINSMECVVASEDFHGTYSSKVNRPFEQGDTIEIYYNPADDLDVYYADEDVMTDTLYNLEYADAKDKYSLFLDNLHSLIIITNSNADTDRVLLLIKDSYANSMVPFLVANYSKIYILDTRYYKNGPSFFMTEYEDITDVLILYNLGTMDSDMGLRAIF